MTVPALDTSIIGTFAYIQPATSIQLADALPYFLVYQQYPEYVDGVMRIYDKGSPPDNYCDVYVRIRTDGWMMAFFPDDAHVGTACWAPYPWILANYANRGDLVWWGHVFSTSGNPPTNATRLARALYELWQAVKANSDNPTYVFDYADVGYYDYEHTTSLKIYIFGRTGSVGGSSSNLYWYFTVPTGTSVQCAFMNYSWWCRPGYGGDAWLKINKGTAKEHTIFSGGSGSNSAKFLTSDVLTYVFMDSVQNMLHNYIYCASYSTYFCSAAIIFADA